MSRFNETYTLPFKFDIPNYTEEFLKKKSAIKILFKFFKRYLYINLKSQKLLEIYSILPLLLQPAFPQATHGIFA